MLRQLNVVLFSTALVSALALVTFAQDGSDEKKSSNRQSDSNSADDSDRGSRFSLEPGGWITIGVDTNNDGYYDTFETLFAYDLVKARQASQERSGKKSQSQSGGSPIKKAKIQGEITKLRTEGSSDSSSQRLVAEIKNSEGRTAQVCLGPKSKLSKLDLQKGDTVSAEGVLTRKDNKLVLLAAKISANDQTVTHKLTRRQGISRMQGTVTSLNEAKSKRGDGTYLIAKIKTEDGTKEIHLGSKQRLSSLELSKGDDVEVLARKGKVSGKKASIALEVSANGETVKVVPPQQINQAQKQPDSSNR